MFDELLIQETRIKDELQHLIIRNDTFYFRLLLICTPCASKHTHLLFASVYEYVVYLYIVLNSSYEIEDIQRTAVLSS